ncbi:MAG: zf-HC2 domain-containing protein [Gemmatimonadota bacterium]
MTCSEFLAQYSEYLDHEDEVGDCAAFEEHLADCASCRRYDQVVTRGLSLLHEIPPPILRGDFRDRLRHSLYTIDEEERVRRQRPDPATGGGAMAVVAAVAVVLAVGLTPKLWDTTPSVELPAIVVDGPVGETMAVGVVPLELQTLPPISRSRPTLVYEADLWEGATTLLYENSSLLQRHRGTGTLIQTGLQ